MKNLFDYKWFRALYQILVVGIILLPYRLVAMAVTVFNTLMAPVSGTPLSEGFQQIFVGIKVGYKMRAYWVEHGKVDYAALMGLE